MKRKIVILIICMAVLCVTALIILNFTGVIPSLSFSAERFNIVTVYSSVDYNGNGIDDYSDFVFGARKDAENHPEYDGSYYEGGYPPDNIGVCTDVVWRAFKQAGYCLKDMVDKDVVIARDEYFHIEEPDSNIDFRRVKNLKVFFERHAVSLTLDINDIDEWQPGDIVIFGDNVHIGIISDKRNIIGQPFVIHNGGQLRREEDAISRQEVTGHYRFDASKLDESVLVKWE